ncbi:MAG: NAD-dependent epimerase/dehydratase family protein [Nocardioidaceae bacterium]|nr:NAD-dependent epimerase/dehydratase family protein [Nocardioidaceae bacterium]
MSEQTTTWVVGAGGLLGQHVARQAELLGHSVMRRPIPWYDAELTSLALREGLRDLVGSASAGGWNVAWCAGAGVVASSNDQLEVEQAVFRRFVSDLAVLACDDGRGAVFLASSAGGVYAGAENPPFTELTRPQPLVGYGWLKLAMEADVAALAEQTGTPVFVGRIANLYGPGQKLSKQQGLVSQLCRAHLTGQPLSLYVSLDTRRDYLYVGDCAQMVMRGLAGLRRSSGAWPDDGQRDIAEAGDVPAVVTKVLASGRSTTVASLIGESVRVFRRRPRLVLAAPGQTTGQVRDLRLRSVVWRDLDRCVRTTLAAGFAATAEDVALHVRRPVRYGPGRHTERDNT